MVGTTALLVMAAISAGSSVASSSIAAHGAKAAAKTQAKSGADALQIEKDATAVAQDRLDRAAQAQADIYNENKGNFSPYTSLGSAAASSLGAIMGLPAGPPSATTMTRAPIPPGPGAPLPGTQAFTTTRPGNAQGIVTNPTGTPLSNPAGGGAPAPLVGPPNMGSLGDVMAPAQQAQSMRGSSYVVIQAPSGETQPVPAVQAQHFIDRGGRIVGGGSAGA